MGQGVSIARGEVTEVTWGGSPHPTDGSDRAVRQQSHQLTCGPPLLAAPQLLPGPKFRPVLGVLLGRQVSALGKGQHGTESRGLSMAVGRGSPGSPCSSPCSSLCPGPGPGGFWRPPRRSPRSLSRASSATARAQKRFPAVRGHLPGPASCPVPLGPAPSSLRGFTGTDGPPQPPLQAEQPQLPQPLLPAELLRSPHLRGPPLGSLQPAWPLWCQGPSSSPSTVRAAPAVRSRGAGSPPSACRQSLAWFSSGHHQPSSL